MFKLRAGDIVEVIKGKDIGKRGKILKLFWHQNHAIVEGLNLVKKHRRRTQQDQQGGIVSIEAPIDLSNIMLFCKSCNRAVRVGFSILKDGTKSRICKSCKETI